MRLTTAVVVAGLITVGSPSFATADQQTHLISEVESSGGDPGDWIELTNPTSDPIDLSGYIIRDSDDTHEFTLPNGSVIEPGQFLVVQELVAGTGGFDFGLGRTDSVRLYDPDGNLVDSVAWTEHAATTYIRTDGGGLTESAEPTPGQPNIAASTASVVINEIQYDDVADAGQVDAVELYNPGSSPVDLTGFSLHDDKDRPGEGDLSGVIKPGEFLVLLNDRDFFFGLGKGDSVVLKDGRGEVVDRYDYEATAPLGNWSRCPDGSGDFAPGTAITLGGPNTCISEPVGGRLVINEIDSAPADYVELYNAGDAGIDLAGVEIRDNADDHRFQLTGGSLAPGEFLVIEATTPGLVFNDQTDAFEPGTFTAAIGIGSGDSIRLYMAEELIDEYSWTEHASLDGDDALATWARCPDGDGAFALAHPTIGASNDCVRPAVVINEVESNGDTTDWVEIVNTSDSPIDISGWYILDNDPIGHATDVTPLPAGTILQPGGHAIFDGGSHFSFGLGANDSVTVYTAAGLEVATYAWTEHAAGVWARCADTTGEFADIETSTPGQPNACGTPVAINEILAGPGGWVELVNLSQSDIDASGLVLTVDGQRHIVPNGSRIGPRGYLIIDLPDLPTSGTLTVSDEKVLATLTWDSITEPSFGRCPDINGDFAATSAATPGERNSCPGIPDLIDWTGSGDVSVIDHGPMFLEDSSGLDYADGYLWAVDNGTGSFWKLIAHHDGTVAPAEGWESPKRARLIKDANNPDAAGPDTEGITIAGDGFLYLAAERDNSDKGVNNNMILQIDPSAPGPDVVASAEWNITALLPEVSANMGIEAIEWVSFADVDGMLASENGTPFSASAYPDAVGGGVFFVALEDNGHVYGVILNSDGSAQVIADIDSKIGGAMALNYDTLTGTLWVVSDDGYNGLTALVSLGDSQITHIERPPGMPNVNNEGFALSDQCLDGTRPAWFFHDGVAQGALTSVQVACETTPPAPDTPGDPETDPEVPSPDDPGVTPSDPGPTPDGETRPSTRLPQTGADAASLALVGLICLAAGMALTRRRSA